MTVFVTGAAGYIGSVVSERLLANGDSVVAFDNLTQGHQAAVPEGARFVEGDLRDRARLMQVLAEVRPDAVMHLAAESLVGTSVTDPAVFYEVNVAGGLNLLDAMRGAGVTRLVFSSTAAVYGEPAEMPIREDAPLRPVNAYGASKLAFEQALGWYASAYGLRHCSLRYFNACGATAARGEFHVPETHLIGILIEVALGLRDEVRDLRDRLRHAGRHLHPRLRACCRYRRRAPAGAGPDRYARHRRLQPGERRRFLQPRGGRGGAAGHRPRDPGRRCAAPAG